MTLVLALVALATTSAKPVDPDIFPDATLYAAESAALAVGGRAPRVFRSDRPFEIVVNYYRFKRKQSVHVVRESLAAPFDRIANAFERGGTDALVASRFVRQFHTHTFGVPTLDPVRAAAAWRAYARRVAGPLQQIGEGERVTIYRPYVSRETFTVIDETVIVLQSIGGSP